MMPVNPLAAHFSSKWSSDEEEEDKKTENRFVSPLAEAMSPYMSDLGMTLTPERIEFPSSRGLERTRKDSEDDLSARKGKKSSRVKKSEGSLDDLSPITTRPNTKASTATATTSSSTTASANDESLLPSELRVPRLPTFTTPQKKSNPSSSSLSVGNTRPALPPKPVPQVPEFLYLEGTKEEDIASVSSASSSQHSLWHSVHSSAATTTMEKSGVSHSHLGVGSNHPSVAIGRSRTSPRNSVALGTTAATTTALSEPLEEGAVPGDHEDNHDDDDGVASNHNGSRKEDGNDNNNNNNDEQEKQLPKPVLTTEEPSTPAATTTSAAVDTDSKYVTPMRDSSSFKPRAELYGIVVPDRPTTPLPPPPPVDESPSPSPKPEESSDPDETNQKPVIKDLNLAAISEQESIALAIAKDGIMSPKPPQDEAPAMRKSRTGTWRKSLTKSDGEKLKKRGSMKGTPK